MEESREPAWSTNKFLLYFWHRHAQALSFIDVGVFYLELFLIPSMALFVLLLWMGRFGPSQTAMRYLGGLLVVVGFPMACIVHGPAPSLMLIELVVALGYLLVDVRTGLSLSTATNLVLTAVH